MKYALSIAPIAVFFLTLLSTTAAPSAAAEVAKLGSQAALFLDDSMIRYAENIERLVHQGRKMPGPVLEPKEPWEGDRVYTMGTVHYDPHFDEFRLWYMARTMTHPQDSTVKSTPQDHVLLATSKDGIDWTRPNLGVHEFQGSKENNILLINVHSPSVVVLPDEDEDDRYKLMGMKYDAGGYVTATSPDGIHWKLTEPLPAIKGGDNVTLTRDPSTGQYMSFHRQSRRVGNHSRRCIFLSISDDFRTWSKPEPVFVPDARDDAAWVTDPERQRTEFYNMTATAYQTLYLGFLTVCRFEPTKGGVRTANQSGTDGPIHVELTFNHDGRRWERLPDRPPILTPGPSAWDQGMILSLSNPIVHKDEIWIYYTGFNTTHGGPRPPKRSAIGLAKWRLDGFVSLQSRNDRMGVIETVLVDPENPYLYVNANAENGSLTAELLDEQRRVIPGYSHEECRAVVTDDVRSAIRWQNHDTVPKDRPFFIRFHLTDGEVFSFSFNSPQPARRSRD